MQQNTLILSNDRQIGFTSARLPEDKYIAVRNSAIFQKNVHSGGHFIFRGPNWKWGSKFDTIDQAFEALAADSVKGHVRIFKGNVLHGEVFNGWPSVRIKPIPQLL